MFLMKVIKNKNLAYFSMATLFAGTLLYLFPPQPSWTNAAENTDSRDITFSVNVEDSLNLTVNTPDESSWAKGDANDFLRNKVSVEVSSNNGNGFTAGMTTKEVSTDLTNIAKDTAKIPTLGAEVKPQCAGETCEAFPANFWGYSLDDTESYTGTYNALVGSDQAPITILSQESGTTTSATKDIYFGAKADKTQASGTYSGTVIFTVASDTNGKDLDPQSPGGDTPVTPGDGPSFEGDTPSDAPSYTPSSPNTYAYSTTAERGTTYSYSSADSDTIAMVNDKKQKNTASGYVTPLGVNEKTLTSANIQKFSIITIILMIIALLTAFIGIFFFILAKRRKDDDDEEIM